jgi:hypothetical protein
MSESDRGGDKEANEEFRSENKDAEDGKDGPKDFASASQPENLVEDIGEVNKEQKKKIFIFFFKGFKRRRRAES